MACCCDPMIFADSAIPLSQKTRDAWNSAGVTLGSGSPGSVSGEQILINLGHLNLSYWGRIYNPPEVVRMLHTPGALRRSPLKDLIPPRHSFGGGTYWLKGPGRGGKNKSKHNSLFSAVVPNDDWDAQVHVEGQEYRVITVGDAIVSVHRKHGNADKSRVYTHVRRSLCDYKVLDMARKAANRLPSQKTVIGWDIITGPQGTFIIEGNTCPGVNGFSAQGIVDAIRQQ